MLTVMRSTSLKTSKSPPTSTRRKKIVRFADTLGLDLAAVKTIMQHDLPLVPDSAFDHLNISKVCPQRQENPLFVLLSPLNIANAVAKENTDVQPPPRSHFPANDLPSPTSPLSPPTMVAPWMSFPKTRATLIPEFVEPFVQISFIEKVKSQSICLENCYVNPSATRPACVTVTNCIRVLNICFEKTIYCRYTTDNWANFTDVRATYIPSSSDSWSDRFTVTFDVENLTAGQRVQFALRYIAGSEEFWDNNSGANYSLMYRI